jgi:hypothetical protein
MGQGGFWISLGLAKKMMSGVNDSSNETPVESNPVAERDLSRHELLAVIALIAISVIVLYILIGPAISAQFSHMIPADPQNLPIHQGPNI